MKYLISLAAVLLASSTQAALIPDFQFAGNAAPIGGGQYDAGTDAGSSPDSVIEVFLGLATGSLDALSPSGNDATEGSAIRVQVDVEAGDTVSFDWDFETDENPNDPVCPASQCRDFAFYSAVLTTADGLFLLADALDDNAGASGSVLVEASGAGTLQIGIGVMDANDTLIGSFITASNFVFTDVNPPGPGPGPGPAPGPGPGPAPGPGPGPGAVPAPMTLALFGLGLLSIGASQRRRKA